MCFSPELLFVGSVFLCVFFFFERERGAQMWWLISILLLFSCCAASGPTEETGWPEMGDVRALKMQTPTNESAPACDSSAMLIAVREDGKNAKRHLRRGEPKAHVERRVFSSGQRDGVENGCLGFFFSDH